MPDEIVPPPYIFEGADSTGPAQTTAKSMTSAVRETVHRAGEAFDAAKRPGMPLSILSNIAREAPLGALFAAFVIGVMVGRRG